MTKEELNEYRALRRVIMQLEERLAELESEATRMTARLSDEPRGKSTKDRMAELVVRMVELDAKIRTRLAAAYALETRIEEAIESLPKQNWRYILRAKYIEGKTFEQIAVDLCYTYRHVTRMHGWALQALREV